MRARIVVVIMAVLAVSSARSTGEKLAVKVVMSDGVRLATDVYLPRGGGPAPVVLLRTPYNKGSGGSRGLTAAGYAVVVQDMRGRFASEGENLPFIGCGWVKHRDGADTIDWIRRQKWCNGRVATAGGSALGITQGLLAGAQPKGLVCLYIGVAAASVYHHAAYVGGALRKSQVERWIKMNRFDAKALKMYTDHPCYDEFWHGFDSTRKHGVMTAPAMHVGGWFDTFSQGTIDSFVGRQHRGGPGAKGNQKLVMGPWAHGGYRGGGVGELKFPGARHPKKYSAARWLAAWLKDEKNGAKEMPPVAYYVMGNTAKPDAPGNEWRFAKDWPIPAAPTDYYLHADGTLSTKKPPAREGKPLAAQYTFDPSEPCPTVGGCNLVLPSGPKDQGRIEGRKDVLVFTTAPLAKPIEVTGRVAAKLIVTSTAVDTDLSVRFCDVYPDGKSYLMAEGMLRLRYREGFVKGKLMTPGRSYNVTVRCWSTSVVIDKGHRIRVAITSSNYPRFDVNPGTGKPSQGADKAVRQTNSIVCGGSSRIVLPVVAPAKNPSAEGGSAQRGAVPPSFDFFDELRAKSRQGSHLLNTSDAAAVGHGSRDAAFPAFDGGVWEGQLDEDFLPHGRRADESSDDEYALLGDVGCASVGQHLSAGIADHGEVGGAASRAETFVTGSYAHGCSSGVHPGSPLSSAPGVYSARTRGRFIWFR